MTQKILDVPVAHIDDPASVSAVLAELSALHGPAAPTGGRRAARAGGRAGPDALQQRVPAQHVPLRRGRLLLRR